MKSLFNILVQLKGAVTAAPFRCASTAGRYALYFLIIYSALTPRVYRLTLKKAIMDPLTVGLGAGSALLGGLFQGQQNRKSREFAARMYGQQLSDTERFWNMQNEYNSPANQRRLLEEGGYNPAMMYKGAAGSMGAGSMATPSAQRPEFKSPVGQGFDILGRFLDYEIKQAQADNLASDNAVKLETAGQIAANTDLIKAKYGREKLGLALDTELYSTSADYRRESLRKLRADTRSVLTNTDLSILSTSYSVKEAGERILNYRIGRKQTAALIRSTDLGNRLKQLDIELKKNGIQPSDSMPARILGRFLEQYLPERGVGGIKFPKLDKGMFLGKSPKGSW